MWHTHTRCVLYKKTANVFNWRCGAVRHFVHLTGGVPHARGFFRVQKFLVAPKMQKIEFLHSLFFFLLLVEFDDCAQKIGVCVSLSRLCTQKKKKNALGRAKNLIYRRIHTHSRHVITRILSLRAKK